MNISSPFLQEHAPLLFEKVWEQLYLVGVTMCIAIMAGIPLGILVAKKDKYVRNTVMTTANLLQTIPSLALLAFLLPILGIGIKPAIVALSAYALLPIVSNTSAGLLGINRAHLEAADGLGFTKHQKLWMVELPLALPIIISGIRTATTMCVGIATIAAFIGAGGLGDFIYQGISLNDNRLVLLGAIPAAMMALILDRLIKKLEHIIPVRNSLSLNIKHLFSVASILATALGLLVYTTHFFRDEKKQTITIGSKNFTEQFILADMMTELIEKKTSLKVRLKLDLGGTLVAQTALLKGEIDLYPEYTGTAYRVVLHRNDLNKDPKNVFEVVGREYKKRFDVIWLKPFGFNNKQTLLVKESFAKKYKLETISDLLPIDENISLAGTQAILGREDGYPGLKRIYHLQFNQLKLMDASLMYSSIQNNLVQVIMAFSTDGLIDAYHLIPLIDDKALFPPYYAAPIIRESTLRKHPEIKLALRPLLGKINNKLMRNLNYKVQVEKQSPKSVAHAFLVKLKLVT